MSLRSVGCAVVVGVVLLSSGCATLVSGTRQQVSITSTPSGARLVIDDGMTYQTPAVVDLTRGRTHYVRAEMEGWSPAQATIGQGFNAWFLGNILGGGLIGMAVDAVTGAMWSVEPDQLHLVLRDNDGTQARPEEAKPSTRRSGAPDRTAASCPNCGQPIERRAAECPHCGASLR